LALILNVLVQSKYISSSAYFIFMYWYRRKLFPLAFILNVLIQSASLNTTEIEPEAPVTFVGFSYKLQIILAQTTIINIKTKVVPANSSAPCY